MADDKAKSEKPAKAEKPADKATKKEPDKKDGKVKDVPKEGLRAEGEKPPLPRGPVYSEAVRTEVERLTTTERAAVMMLLLGEQQAADIIKFLNPKEVQALGGAMVAVADISQEAVALVLDEFIATIKRQTTLGLGSSDYVENVLKRALGEDKAASVLGRIMPGQASKGLEILSWMDARSIAEMIRAEHPQVIAIILSVLEYDVAADVLNFQRAYPLHDLGSRFGR